MHNFKQITIVLLFSIIANCKAQTDNKADEYFVFKANLGLFYDYDGNRLKHGDQNYNWQGGKYPPTNYIKVKQPTYKPNLFPGAELCYYTKKYAVGLAFSYDRTYYSYSYYSTELVGSFTNGSITKKNYGEGNGSLSNSMFKFIYGFNFNTKFGLNVYVQPLNPELRLIRNGKYTVTSDTYNNYFLKSVVSPFNDSISTVKVDSETLDINFVNYKTNVNYSIALPTLIGVEQKFKLGKLTYVAGASVNASLFEWYLIYRAHIGVCFGNFKNKAKQ